MDVFIKGFVALFDLLKFFPPTFKLLKKNLINARNLLENMISGWKQKVQIYIFIKYFKYGRFYERFWYIIWSVKMFSSYI